MALYEYLFPELGEGIHEGEVVKLWIKPGEIVTDESMIMEVQNDKAVVEVPCPVDGKIVEVCITEGQTCTVGQLVARIEVEGVNGANGAIPSSPPAQEENKTSGIVNHQPRAIETAIQHAHVDTLATPSVRKLARDQGITLHDVQPTGKHGHVTREDVMNHNSSAQHQTLGNVQSESGLAPDTIHVVEKVTPQLDADEDRIPFKGIRKVIANAMIKSVYTAPHVTLMDEVDVHALVAFRERTKPIAEQKAIKLTYLPFIVKALVVACRQYPVMNATIDEEKQEIVHKKYYHVGIATDTDSGLLVPVIRDVDKKNIWSIASAIMDVAKRARESKLSAQELRGSTISITNIGSVGGMFFTPVINFPEVAILGAGRITDKPVVKDGQIVIGAMMALSLSFDHRVVDGATAQAFLNTIKRLLADPELLILEV